MESFLCCVAVLKQKQAALSHVVYLRILKGNHSKLVYISPVSILHRIKWIDLEVIYLGMLHWYFLGYTRKSRVAESVKCIFMSAWPLCHSVFQQRWSIPGQSRLQVRVALQTPLCGTFLCSCVLEVPTIPCEVKNILSCSCFAFPLTVLWLSTGCFKKGCTTVSLCKKHKCGNVFYFLLELVWGSWEIHVSTDPCAAE